MNRIITLDIAKAICIILVVIGHYMPDNSPMWYVVLNRVIYSFHMPLFMFASGYIYIATKKEMTYITFIKKKVKRLLIPYLTTSIIVIGIKLLTQSHMSVDNPVELFSFVRIFYYPEAGYFLWFIWALWWMFVIVPLFKTKNKRIILFGISIVLHFVPLGLPKVFCINSFGSMLMYFMLGVFTFENTSLNKFIKTYNSWKNIISLLLFICFESLYIHNYIVGSKINSIIFMLPFIGIWFVLEFSKFISNKWEIKSNSWLMIVSLSSYIIYLFHTTFEGFAKAILRKLTIDSSLWYIFIPEVIIVVSIGLIIPIILNYYIFNKSKITRFLFGI